MDLNVNVRFFNSDSERINRKLDEILAASLKLEIHMATVNDFVTQQTAFNAALNIALTDLGGDIQQLNDKIAALVAAGGALTADQQAALDVLVIDGAALAAKADALNALTPPVVPVV